MAMYAVCITETLCKTVVVEADSRDVATEMVDRAYEVGDIVLDSGDYFDCIIDDAVEYDEWQHGFCDVLE